ncbi:ABC transporter permease [Pseudonocardia lutea]|uniref:ABC transporter permease n=1 Tax=Pseudonocardia lutea TaxID=2172015 RepID=A0ABW1IFV4_9PSEU
MVSKSDLRGVGQDVPRNPQQSVPGGPGAGPAGPDIVQTSEGWGVGALVNRRLRGLNWPFWLTLVVALVLWESLSHLLDQPLVLAPIERIFAKAASLWNSGALQQDIYISGLEFVFGFLIAVVLGTAVGFMAGYWNRVGTVVNPILSAVQAMPVIGLGPIFIVAFGIGPSSKVAIVALTAFFPIALNACAGVQQTGEPLYELGRSFGLNTVQCLRKIAVPSSIPYLLAGFKVGVGRSLTAVVAGELFGGVHGLGLEIFTAASNFDTASVYVAVAIFAVEGVILSKLLEYAGRKAMPWQNS